MRALAESKKQVSERLVGEYIRLSFEECQSLEFGNRYVAEVYARERVRLSFEQVN